MKTVPDRAAILARLRHIAPERINVDPERFVPGATLADLGIDSFQFIELVFVAEEEYGIKIDLETLHAKKIEDMLDVIIAEIAKKP
jgi:acyl carrier protein